LSEKSQLLPQTPTYLRPMTRIWKKLSQEAIKSRVFNALERNIDYTNEHALGVPASLLDGNVFNQDASFLKEAPFLSTMIQNPNHIGCHTLGNSESFFAGTQEIERELIDICAVDILKGEKGQFDGYVASGGTEANMQAIWIYRNLFVKEYQAQLDEICILCSEDSHYSMDKASNVLGVSIRKVSVGENDRTISASSINSALQEASAEGKKYFIVVSNMMTTMFGSVDDANLYIQCLEEHGAPYRLHLDGAYGGFYYPFSDESSQMNFLNPKVSSVTLDAHKMAQAPYGTGIFLARKGLIQYVNTSEASYVEGEDYTLIGSRSGANAVGAWMILVKYGPFGWSEKVFILQHRTNWMCTQLQEMGVEFYRHPYSNIITIRSSFIDPKIAEEFGLVPDNHKDPKWFKIVVMEHVTVDKLAQLTEKLKSVIKF
jgi:tyrosine decarboxylase/aspartate 1-decarboxylase